MTQLKVYGVDPDYHVGGKRGADSLEWLETDDENLSQEQADRTTAIGQWSPLASKWTPCAAQYALRGKQPICSAFFEFSSFLAATCRAKSVLSPIADFEWLPLNPVHGTPPELSAQGSPSFYVMRFARKVTPHPASKFTYFPGTKSIDDVISLVLSKTAAEDLYAFRLEGDPVTFYATQKLVDICEREGLKGLKFTPIDCEFK